MYKLYINLEGEELGPLDFPDHDSAYEVFAKSLAEVRVQDKRFMLVIRDPEGRALERAGLLSKAEYASVEVEDRGGGWTRYIMRVPAEHGDKLMKKLTRLHNDMVKLGFEEPIIEREKDEVVELHGHVYANAVMRADVWMPDRRSAPWSLLANKTRTSADSDQVVIDRMPGVYDDDIPAEFWEDDFSCEHCHATRNRFDVKLIESDVGEIKQVGSTCVGKYLKEQAHLVMRQAKLIHRMKKIFDDVRLIPEPKEALGYDTLRFLAYVCRSIRMRGYHKSRADRPTWAEAEKMFNEDRFVFERNTTRPADESELVPNLPLLEDFSQAREVFRWAVDELEPDGDWARNAKAVVNSPFVKPDRSVLAIVASIPRGWKWAQERKTKSRKAEVAGYFGKCDERYEDVEVKVVQWGDGEGRFGPWRRLNLVTRKGHRLVWWTAPGVTTAQELIDRGEGWSTVNMTVVEHKPYRSLPQTKVTRLYYKGPVVDEAGEYIGSTAELRDPHSRQAPDMRTVDASERILEVD